MSPTLVAPTAEALARERPESRAWLDLLEITAAEAQRRAWDDAVPDGASAAAPLLAGTTLMLDPRVAADWLRRLLAAAAAHAPALSSAAARLDALAALEAAIALDVTRVDAIADAAALPREPLRAVVPLLAYPWLERCARRLTAPDGADHAWCPTCGAWAGLAEARGLEAARRLRCLRCGGDWNAAWMRCPFCGTTDHDRLRALVAEATAQTRRADGCAGCGAWVKTVTTLGASSVADLRLLDLATVDLDVAALSRGWQRPAGLGAPLGVRVVGRGRRWLR
jgi:FdhE protein